MLESLLIAVADTAAAPDLTTLVGTGFGVLLTALNGIQAGQLNGLRHDLQASRSENDRRMRILEDRVEALEIRPQKLTTGSRSTTRGRR